MTTFWAALGTKPSSRAHEDRIADNSKAVKIALYTHKISIWRLDSSLLLTLWPRNPLRMCD
jgi:hypothetical protein